MDQFNYHIIIRWQTYFIFTLLKLAILSLKQTLKNVKYPEIQNI